MTSYMYNPSKKVTEILSKFLEFDPEELQLGIWSGDLVLNNVNLRGDALYSKINRMKKSPSGRDPLKLKIVESKISQLRIQIPWKRLVWGQGDVIIDIKGINFVVGFESREETEARQEADAKAGKKKTKKDQDEVDEHVLRYSKGFRTAKQKCLAEAEHRLMKGQHLGTWLAQMKKELESELQTPVAAVKKAKGFNKWMERASSGFVWKVLSGLQLNIEGFKLTIVQDNIEVGVIMPSTYIYSGKLGSRGRGNTNTNNVNNQDDNKSFSKPPEPEEVEEGENIDKAVDALGVSIFIRRSLQLQNDQLHPPVLLPDDYVLRPIDLNCSLSVFYPREEQSRKRKVLAESYQANGPDHMSMGGEESTVSSFKKRRGKREKQPIKAANTSTDGTAETDVVSSFAPHDYGMQRQRSHMTNLSDGNLPDYNAMMDRGNKSLNNLTFRRQGTSSITAAGASRSNYQNRPSNMQRLLSGAGGAHAPYRRNQSSNSSFGRSAPLVKPDDLSSVYAYAMAESQLVTPKFDLKLNCGEIKLVLSSQHLETLNMFFAVGARMRNGRPTATIADVLVTNQKGNNKRSMFSGSASVEDPNAMAIVRRREGIAAARMRNEFPSRRISMGMAQKVRTRRTQVVKSWWHYSYGVVAYEIQKRKLRRDKFRAKYVSFDWDRQKTSRTEYVNLYLSLSLDVGQHVDLEESTEDQDPDVEEFLRMEDVLPVEQILLYRSIARALAINDIGEMPSSLEVLYKDYANELAAEQRRASMTSGDHNSMHITRRLSMQEYIQTLPSEDDDEENLLGMIGKRCDKGRKYRSYFKQDNVQLFDDEQKHKLVNNKQQQQSSPQDANDRRHKRNNARNESMGLGTDSGDRELSRREELGGSKVSFSADSYTEELEATVTPSRTASKTASRRRGDGTDGRTIRTFKTTKSAKSSAIAGTVFEYEHKTNQEDTAQGAKLSFIMSFKSVELMLVADTPIAPPTNTRTSRMSHMSSGSSGSSDDVSELSFQSEEDFFREQDTAPIAAIEEEETDENPMLSSTDFLLFGMPKNMLLHVTLSPLRLTVLGRSGGSKNVNLNVGSITASGDGRDNLIAIGSRASPTPVPVVSLTKTGRSGSSHDAGFRSYSGGQSGPKEAVTFSLVIHKGHKVLQADVSKVHVSLDIPLLIKLMEFPSTSDAGNPRRTLPKSEREEARLFILRENPPSKFAGINSSIRIHGIELSVPVEQPGLGADIESSASSHSGSFERPENNSPLARISASIVEMYSGTAVDDLCGGETQVGSLSMLDVAELVTSRGTLSSHHCVVAVSGVDCVLKTETDMFAFSNAPSLVAEPIDVEMLFTTNGSTILDEDSPRQEIVVEVSPVHILLSETRLLFCNRVLRPLKTNRNNKQAGTEEVSIPPRLEALSRLIMRCLDVSIRRLKVSLMSDEQKYPLTPGQKEIIMEESISDFLSIVSCFDLTFPNEDALSTAMQICIDRLCGLGLFPDDAWDCANSALLSFLEDDAHFDDAKGESDDMDTSEMEADATEQSINISEMDGSIQLEDARRDASKQMDDSKKKEGKKQGKSDRASVDTAIRNAVSRALVEFPPPDDEMDPERQPVDNLLVIDMPGGAQVSTIQLFYDFHLAASLPTLFMTNTAGVRLLRIVPIESNLNDSYDQGSSVDESEEAASEPGLVFSRFLLDADHSFGKGGLPLSVLSSDEGAFEESIVRIREKLDDLQIGEFEFTFSYRSFKDMLETINKLKSCTSSPQIKEGLEDSQDKKVAEMPVKSSLFVKGDVVSVLMASDELAPFSRLRLESLYLKRDGPPLNSEDPHIDVYRVVSRNCALLNLTEQGQFYPDAITVLYNDNPTAFPFQLHYTMNSPPWQVGSKMELWFRGYRIFLLRNFINELLQYLLSDGYGIGRYKHEAKVAEELRNGGVKDTTPSLLYRVHILDSSLILPRSSKNHDMLCLELPKGLIYNSRHQNSFQMPTATTSLKSEKELDPSEAGKKFFTRMNIQLHGTRIFSSLGVDRSTHGDDESPIFRYFYDVAGRAQDNGWVYTSLAADFAPPEALIPEFEALCQRRWKEITTGVLSLDILVDYVPSLRCLICEPLDLKDFVVAPRLDLRMSQFNLLLSVWYANMQELPVMFPYPPKKFMADGRNLLYHTVPAEYGTDEYLEVWNDWSRVKTEICVVLRNLSMRTQFDPFEYHDVQPEIKTFYDNPDDLQSGHCVQVHFTDVVVHTFSDLRGMMRVAVGAAGFDLIDERRGKRCQRTFGVAKKPGLDKDKFTSFADLSWGLQANSKQFDQDLPQPVQISVYMTKDWSLINLGLDAADGILVELSPIWFFLGFFVGYFQYAEYGHPCYIGNERARKVKDVLQNARKVELKDPEGMNIDFRLWLTKPHLCIPCDLVDARAPSLRIESETALWYRFKKIREYKSQEVISTGLDLIFANEFLAPREKLAGRDSTVRHLVERLSFALRLDNNNDACHSDYALQIPYDVNCKSDCSLKSHEINVSPIILEAPTICSPVESPSRSLGPSVCEITCIVEVLPLTSSVMVNFFKGPVADEILQAIPGYQPPIEDEAPYTTSFSADIADLRLFAVDPVLGVQLPIAVFSISSLVVSANQLSTEGTNKAQISRGESPPEDLQVSVNCNLWGDYFKLGVTRSWEPLLEPYNFVLLYEKSRYRGTGLSLNADCPLHVNVSGALLLIIDDVVDSFSRLIGEAFGHDTESDIERVMPKSSLLRERLIVGEKVRLNASQSLTVLHDIPKPLLEDRVAFSLCNLTGQKMRIHQQEGFVRPDEKLKPAVVTYLNHDEATSLSFDATISVVKNLSVVEVPYPGLPNSQSMERAERSTRHAVDVQLPGFRWVQGIKVDTFGRKFECLRPRSNDLVGKILQDWRLENALQLLVEVGLDNGGRLVTVRSLFEVRNNTTHPLSLLLHPDPQHKPDNTKKMTIDTEIQEGEVSDSISIVNPGDFFQIPTFLLESSLHMGGSHLGSMWLKPNSHDDISFPSLVPGVGHEGSGESNFETVFSSRPVQLAKLVQESAMIYEEYGDSEIAPEIAKSGIQIACSVKNENGEPLAPFCYAIEVGRSPIVADKRKSSPLLLGAPELHGPVAYTLSVHAPFVIANLLPETGRFELMHAVRRTVLWYGDLKPGQQVPVHSVGLDAPLLLLLNLGFCRTPVGEGALVHHGADVSVTKDNALRALVGKSAGAVGKVGKVVTKTTGTVGKAVTKSKVGKVVKQRTKRVGKSLNSVDSPEKRLAEDPNNPDLDVDLYEMNRSKARQYQDMGEIGDMGLDMGMDTPDGKVHSVETNLYSPSDVAAETEVVDSIGQRLTLSIENIRGGGGQRRIAVYCPFWIVNTTQHSLRYKQEGSKSFVSGTVVDSERDGSKPVDGSTRNYVNRHQLARATRMNPDKHLRSHRPMNDGTIFAGTVGALATSPGRCDLSPTDLTDLIDKDLSLERLANLAFMFNFHEDVLSIGNRRLAVQLADATAHVQYFSDWSRGFSLDSVGFSQIVALHCREGRALELSVVVSVAPGFLSGYTKIVRLVPRYVLVNQLEFPVRLWQDSSVFRPLNENRSTAGLDELVRGTDVGKWRFATPTDEHVSVINEYEALWGRVTLLEESENERIMDGTTAHRNASYITSAGPLEFVPFHLPDSRGERQLRVGLGATWNLTASFASDFPGDHTLRVTRAVDLRFVRHVSTRASPQYKVSLPPSQTGGESWDGELGIWFETDWGGDKRIIVKGMKRGRYCFNETDIHAGDELLRIDNVAVSRMTFGETMKLLKQRVAQISATSNNNRLKMSDASQSIFNRSSAFLRRRINDGGEDGFEAAPDRLVLTFRTLEERLRRLRLKAAKSSGIAHRGRAGQNLLSGGDSVSQQEGAMGFNGAAGGLRVEMKPLHHSMFVVLRRQNPANPPFRIENRSMNHTIFYRQRGCEAHAWNHLKPGQSQAYSWEEPMRPKRLAVRAAKDGLFPNRTDSEPGDDNSNRSFSSEGGSREIDHRAARSSHLRQILSYQYVEDEEQGRFGAMTIVKLEEIGYRGFLATPLSGEEGETRRGGHLNVEVETDGATRILVVSDDTYRDDEVAVMNRRLETLKRQVREEESRLANLAALRFLMERTTSGTTDANDESILETQALSSLPLYERQVEGLDESGKSRAIEDLSKNITDDFPEDISIHRRHQVVVEVLEAVGLNPENEIGSCNPYCEVLLKGRSKLRKSFFEKKTDRGKTYYSKKSLAPKWTDQIFVFDVPPEAVSVTRGHSLHVRVRNFRFVGAHKLLGQAIVHLHSVRDQQELIGWYPLAGRTGSTELDNPLSHWGRGSVKLRIHWVHSTPSLLDYFIMFTEKRLLQLQDRKHGLRDQWRQAADAEKRKKEKDLMRSTMSPSVPKVHKDRKSGKQMLSHSSHKEDDFDGDDSRSGTSGLQKLAQDRKRFFQKFKERAQQKENREAGDDHGLAFDSEQWAGSHSGLPKITEHANSSAGSSYGSGSDDTSVFLTSGSDKSTNDSFLVPNREQPKRGSLKAFQFGEKSMSNVKAWRRPTSARKGRASLLAAGVLGGDNSKVLARNAGKIFAQKLFQRLSASQKGANNEDLMQDSSNLGEEDEAVKLSNKFSNMDTVKELLEQGLLFHEVGQCFHRVDPYRFHGRTDDGSPLDLPLIRSWTIAQSWINDESLDVKIDDGKSFNVVIHDSVKSPRKPIESGGSFCKKIAREKISLPPTAPVTMGQRALQHVEYLVQSRNQFERACRRALRSVLNPGGWLTIRPITALNLPDTYTGMHVKLKYGPEVVVSSTVDAKVTPTWTPKDVMSRVNTIPDMYEDPDGMYEEGNEDVPAALNMDRFEFYENDLLFYVEPQKTSGSIRLSVVGERLNNKTELGVLHIPLGAAIGSCIDCIEDYLDSFSESAPAATPMYVRWFPLMNPKDTDPVEGDMGLSSRPPESEKLGDDQFIQYFAPCIQLALMWWPDDREVGPDMEEEYSELQEGSQSFHPANSEVEAERALTNNYFNADIGRISAALIDSERAKELLSFSALDIDLRYSETDAKTRIGLVIGWVQLDHQEDKSREPVVLAPKPVEHIQPTCQLLVVKDNLRSKKNIMSYEHIRLTLEEMDLTIEEAWLFDLWDFFIGVVRRREVRKKANSGFEEGMKGDELLTTESRFINIEPSDPDSPGLLSLLVGEHSQEDASAGKVYVEQLVLGLLKVNLSYVKGKQKSWELTDKGDWVTKNFDATFQAMSQTQSQNFSHTEEVEEESELFTKWSQHTYDEDLWAERQGKRSQNLKGIIGAVLPNVSDAPIRLQGKVLDNVFESPAEILSSISKFYVMETLRQVYKIIGSLDFVGNPTMLFSSFVSGVRDLVVTPSVAFLKSPTNPSLVGIGVAKGTLSLFSHSTSGIFGFLAKTTAAAGQAAAVLSLDREYRDWHRERVVIEATNLNREWKKRGVKSVSAMVAKPVGDIVLGALMGVSGLFTAPYKGYRDGGKLGLTQGVAIGGVGLVVKPIVGLLDAFAHFTASIHDIAKSVNILERRYQPVLKLRLPYTFGLTQVLTPFDSVASRSVYLLKSFVPKSPKARSQSLAWKETHVASEVLHLEPGVDTYSIVTTLRVVLMKVKKDNNGKLVPAKCWEVVLAKDDKVKSQVSDHGHNGVALTITRRYKPATKRFQRRKMSASTENQTQQATPMVGHAHMNKIAYPDENLRDAHASPSGDDLGSGRGDDPETPVEDGDADDLASAGSIRQQKNSWEPADKEDAYHGHGATRGNEGEMLEWFTVLAEYPNRPQLTRIHNAICCILGNFDEIVEDKHPGQDVDREGATTFGTFDFEKNWADDSQFGSTERFIMSALERLPWMHDTTFEVTRGKSHEEQRSILREIREKWVFSRELEASIKLGGPAWLVEARAHALFVPSESPLPPPSVPRNDPIVKQILYQQDHGNISREKVRMLFECHLDELQGNNPRHTMWRRSTTSEQSILTEEDDEDEDFDSFAKMEEYQSAFSEVSKTVVRPGSSLYDTELTDFKSQDLEVFQSAFEEMPTTLVRPGSGMSTDYDDAEEYDSESVVSMRTGTTFGSETALDKLASTERPSASPRQEGGGNAATLTPLKLQTKRAANSGTLALSTSNRGSADDRIDRMEGLMEQLVIFNSQLALMKGPSMLQGDAPNLISQPPSAQSTAVFNNEIHALRRQLQQQASKDEATNEILLDLKDELATIRAELSINQEETDKPKKSPKKKKSKDKKKKNNLSDEEQFVESAKAKKKKRSTSIRWFKGSGKGSKGKRKSGGDLDSALMSGPLTKEDHDAVASSALGMDDKDENSKTRSPQNSPDNK